MCVFASVCVSVFASVCVCVVCVCVCKQGTEELTLWLTTFFQVRDSQLVAMKARRRTTHSALYISIK